jgi:acyl carrier protein
VTHSEILERLKKIIGQVVGNDQITLNNDTTADDIPGWDSLNHINIIMGAEMEFGVRFKTAEQEGLKNVGEFVSLIEKHLASKK